MCTMALNPNDSLHAACATQSDADNAIFAFALNLEYLESQFYGLVADVSPTPPQEPLLPLSSVVSTSVLAVEHVRLGSVNPADALQLIVIALHSTAFSTSRFALPFHTPTGTQTQPLLAQLHYADDQFGASTSAERGIENILQRHLPHGHWCAAGRQSLTADQGTPWPQLLQDAPEQRSHRIVMAHCRPAATAGSGVRDSEPRVRSRGVLPQQVGAALLL